MTRFGNPDQLTLAEEVAKGVQEREARQARWDSRFLRLAREVSTWSKDPSTKVGAVIVRPNRTIAATGYNGFPRGIADTAERLNDRPLKYSLVLHGEVNAVLNAREPLHGYTLYEWPPGFGPTCENCALHVIQAGITRVVGVLRTDEFASRWKESCEKANALYKEAGVVVDMYPPEVMDLA